MAKGVCLTDPFKKYVTDLASLVNAAPVSVGACLDDRSDPRAVNQQFIARSVSNVRVDIILGAEVCALAREYATGFLQL